MIKFILSSLPVAALAVATLGIASPWTSAPAEAAGSAPTPPAQKWSWQGPFGTFERPALRRGLQVHLEICSACHSLDLVAYRALSEIGLSDDEIKAVASEFVVVDGPDDDGDMFEREALPADHFVAPFENDNAARASNGGALPPDLSLMTKARVHGPDYLYGLLTGYVDPPVGVEVMPGMYYNEYYPGHQIAMAPPIDDDLVEYADGTAATTDQIARDVTTFLAWAAEPELEERKRLGVKVMLVILILTGFLYALKKRIWADQH